MKRNASPGSSDGPAKKYRFDDEFKEVLGVEESKQFYKQVDTSGKVVWSGTVKIPDSQKIVFDCSIKTLPQDEGIKSLFPLKQLTMHILPFSAEVLLYPYRVQSRKLILCTDKNTDMMSYSDFFQAIRFGDNMRGCAVLKNTASALHLLCVGSFSYEHEDYIVGFIETYQANDTVLGILRSHGLLPCADPEHKELVKQNALLEEELRLWDKKLTEQQRLNQKLVKRHKKKMAEKERKHEEERNMMEEQMRDKERTITTLDRKIKDVQHGKEEIVIRMFSEFQCCICRETLKQASTLPVCGHMFCHLCISDYLKMKAKCPLCRSCTGSPIQCIGIDRLINNLTEHMGNEAQQQGIKALKDHTENVHALPIEEGGSSQEEVVVPEGVRVRELDVSSEAVDGERLPGEQANARLDSFLATLPMEIQLSSPSSSSSEDEPTGSQGNQM